MQLSMNWDEIMLKMNAPSQMMVTTYYDAIEQKY